MESWQQEEILPSAERARGRVQTIYNALGPRLGYAKRKKEYAPFFFIFQ